jgi:hypothetical protein
LAVADVDDADTRAAESIDVVEEPIGLGEGEDACRFVEDDDLGLLGDGGGDLSQVSFGDAQGVGRLSHVDGMSQRLDGSAGVGVDFAGANIEGDVGQGTDARKGATDMFQA